MCRGIKRPRRTTGYTDRTALDESRDGQFTRGMEAAVAAVPQNLIAVPQDVVPVEN